MGHYLTSNLAINRAFELPRSVLFTGQVTFVQSSTGDSSLHGAVFSSGNIYQQDWRQ
jgi:hypothetical protein